jgi:O-antigen/teichoic acid export membrane protein
MSDSIKSKALSGGFVLVGREFGGIVLSLIGMLVTTRLLGPHRYGQFVIVSGLAGYALNVGKLGLDVYLIRYQGELNEEQVGVTQGLYLALGLFFAAIAIALGPVVSWWYKDPLLCKLLWSYAILIPLTLVSSAPIALLDRQLSYKNAAMTELAGQLTYVAISVSIVWFTRSIWGIIIGLFGQALITVILASLWSKMQFRPRWNTQEAKAQMRYGFGYAASTWIWQARNLVNPLLVGKLLGAEAAAYVAMAVRISGFVGFGRTAVYRVYMSYLARLAGERDKMKEAIETGLSYQVLITGVSFIAFLAIAPDLIHGLMGQKWMPILDVLPFIAAGVVVNSGFGLYSSALYVIGKNQDVSLFHVLYMIFYVFSAWIFLKMSGSITAYGWAEIAAFPSYILIRYSFRMRFFAIKENLMYVNIIFVLSGLLLSIQLVSGPIWLRIGTASILLLIILFGLPQNRSASLVMLNTAKQKFAPGKA